MKAKEHSRPLGKPTFDIRYKGSLTQDDRIFADSKKISEISAIIKKL